MSGVSLGTRALLLIRLDGRLGQHVSVETLAACHRLRPDVVREGLQSLWDEGCVRCPRGAGGLIGPAWSMVGA